MLPRLAITMGDVAGIGPELIVRSWSPIQQWCRPWVVGHPKVLQRAIRLLQSGHRVASISAPQEAQPAADVIPCLLAGDDEVVEVAPGQVDARAGRAAFQFLKRSVELTTNGQFDAIVTAPLNKQALNQAGYHYPGHTEALAELCGRDEAVMMLYLGPGDPLQGPAGLGVVHVTLHQALAEVPRHLEFQRVLGCVRLLHHAMQSIKGAPPRLGLAALNPHAGEGGLFGTEEREVLGPAVRQAQQEGINVTGPHPADTLFCKARDGDFDGVVAMYHDQGHIALKLVDFHRAVNVTLGLPIIRTSPTYGTAFDIAWKGTAEWKGMLEAVRVAAQLASQPVRLSASRKQHWHTSPALTVPSPTGLRSDSPTRRSIRSTNSRLPTLDSRIFPYPMPDPDSAFLFLVRHGATEANIRDPQWLQGSRVDLPLCPLGALQAQAVAEFLHHFPVDRIVSSPLQRASQTAEIISQLHDCPVEHSPSLAECDVGRWEGWDWNTIQERDGEQYRQFMENPAEYGYPDGESFADVLHRAAPTLEALLQEGVGKITVAVSHHVVNRTYLSSLFGIPLAQARSIRQDNGGVNLIRWRGGKTQVLVLNSAFHLAPLPVPTSAQRSNRGTAPYRQSEPQRFPSEEQRA